MNTSKTTLKEKTQKENKKKVAKYFLSIEAHVNNEQNLLFIGPPNNKGRRLIAKKKNQSLPMPGKIEKTRPNSRTKV